MGFNRLTAVLWGYFGVADALLLFNLLLPLVFCDIFAAAIGFGGHLEVHVKGRL